MDNCNELFVNVVKVSVVVRKVNRVLPVGVRAHVCVIIGLVVTSFVVDGSGAAHNVVVSRVGFDL